jgi:hypothetical protein
MGSNQQTLHMLIVHFSIQISNCIMYGTDSSQNSYPQHIWIMVFGFWNPTYQKTGTATPAPLQVSLSLAPLPAPPLPTRPSRLACSALRLRRGTSPG